MCMHAYQTLKRRSFDGRSRPVVTRARSPYHGRSHCSYIYHTSDRYIFIDVYARIPDVQTPVIRRTFVASRYDDRATSPRADRTRARCSRSAPRSRRARSTPTGGASRATARRRARRRRTRDDDGNRRSRRRIWIDEGRGDDDESTRATSRRATTTDERRETIGAFIVSPRAPTADARRTRTRDARRRRARGEDDAGRIRRRRDDATRRRGDARARD